jgi:hypothetical protein
MDFYLLIIISLNKGNNKITKLRFNYFISIIFSEYSMY